MDRAEAIKILEIQLDVTEVNTPSCIKLHEALDLAIEALKEPTGDYEFFGGTYANEGDAESPTTTDCISRADAIEAVRGCKFHAIKGSLQTAPWYEAINEVLEILSALPPVNQKQITGKLESVENATSEGEESTMGQAKSKLDCISRQEAVEALTGWDTEPLDEDIVRTLNNLPPVTPTERTGEWLDACYSNPCHFVCSECKRQVDFEENFCPNCGAKMGGDTE